MAVSILIAGDVVPKGVTPEYFIQRGDSIFSDFSSVIRQADFCVVNLEAPIIKEKPTPIKKSGPCLGVARTTIDVLKNNGFDIFTLANNHFFDQGQKGVNDTIDECEAQNIKVVGGGKTKADARKPLMLDKNGKRIAIINACEHEFSIATDGNGGSNPLDLINMQEDIAAMRKEADYVVLIMHGGIEQYHYPTPRMKRWYRHFVDLGADAVINHHQHCVNGYEVYKGKPIFYGLGNFYFPWGSQPRPESWKYGYLVKLTLGDMIEFELLPYVQTAEAITLRDKRGFEKELEHYNLVIQDDILLEQTFKHYVQSIENKLKVQLLPSFLKGKYLSAAARQGWFGKLYKGKDLYSIKNKLTCESHYEALQYLFTILTK